MYDSFDLPAGQPYSSLPSAQSGFWLHFKYFGIHSPLLHMNSSELQAETRRKVKKITNVCNERSTIANANNDMARIV